LKKEINGEEVRRSYSICVSPIDEEWRVAVKKIPNGRFSTFANEQLTIGDTLDVMPPMGNFYTQLSPSQSKHYVAFAAGSGITPIMSILKTALSLEPTSRFTLFYGNRYSSAIIFKESIEALKKQFLERFNIHYFLSREELDAALFNGRMDKAKITDIFNQLFDPKQADEFFLCGPEAMIFDLQEELVNRGINKKQIHFELFTTAKSKKAPKITTETATTTEKSEIKVRLDGQFTTFELAREGENVLDAALKHGMDLPFACKGGVCCTCKAKLLEGKVHMDVNYALEEEEVEAGYILTCQSHPTTPKIVVDFDAAL